MLQLALDVIKVKHVMVVGHYGCGGVLGALRGLRLGLVDNWLRHVQDVRMKHRELIDSFPPEQQHDRFVELNVIEQVVNVCQTTVVQDAWARKQDLSIHGWIYAVQDGLLRDLRISTADETQLTENYERAIGGLKSGLTFA